MDKFEVTDGNNSSNEASTSKSSPAPIFHRKRGRPRKGTYVPRSSSLDLSCFNDGSKVKKSIVKQKKKRNYDSVEEKGGTSFDLATEQSCSRENSKRRRQPKVLDDYVTDFGSSDEEEKFCRSAPFQSSKQRSGTSKGQNKKVGEMHCLESDDIFSYLDSFDKNFADQDLFGSEFLEGDHEGSKEDISGETSKDILVGDTSSEGKLPTEVLSPERGQQDSDLKITEGAIFTSRQKEREWKQTVRTHRQQLAALQQKYYQLVQKIQKKPQFTKVVDLVHGASKLLNEDQLVFFTLQLKANSKNLQGVRFSTREKVLALAIYTHRPETYRWLQSIFFLPSKLILDRWLETIAKDNPTTAKQLMYHIFKKYIFN